MGALRIFFQEVGQIQGCKKVDDQVFTVTTNNTLQHFQGQVPSNISFLEGGACVRRRGRAPVPCHNGTMASPSLVDMRRPCSFSCHIIATWSIVVRRIHTPVAQCPWQLGKDHERSEWCWSLGCQCRRDADYDKRVVFVQNASTEMSSRLAAKQQHDL